MVREEERRGAAEGQTGQTKQVQGGVEAKVAVETPPPPVPAAREHVEHQFEKV